MTIEKAKQIIREKLGDRFNVEFSEYVKTFPKPGIEVIQEECKKKQQVLDCSISKGGKLC